MTTDASDDELVFWAGRGDKAAFGQIVARHQRRLMAVAMLSVGSRTAAEDVVQEVFTRAWVKAPTWQSRREGGGASYGAWLSRVAVNLCIDGARRQRTTTREDVPDTPDPAASADEILLTQERAVRVRAALARLSERQRRAISLGGFTTYSTFSLDTALLWERGEVALTFAYVGGTLLLGFSSVFGGLALVRAVTP